MYEDHIVRNKTVIVGENIGHYNVIVKQIGVYNRSNNRSNNKGYNNDDNDRVNRQK